MKNKDRNPIRRYFPIFVLPTLICFTLFFVVPFFMGIGLSFTKFTTVTDITSFVGFKNYIKAFTVDHEDEHHHDDEDETHGHHHDEAPEYDEHVWLSVRNAKIIVNALAQNISKLDAKNEAKYAANAAAYTKQLATLDAEFVDVVNASNKKVVLFGDRFPFRYLVDDYGIKYYAAFVGCSAETEASFETVSFLSEKVNELGLNVVLTIEKSNQKIAKTIIRNSKNKNCKIMEMDSLQSVTKKDIKKGISYLGVMKDNLKVLKEALK